MEMSNAMLGATIKRIAKSVAPFSKQIERLEAKKASFAKKIDTEIESIKKVKDLQEKPVVELTGHTLEELVNIKRVEAGTDKDGKTIFKTVIELKYPETVLPPEPAEKGQAAEAEEDPGDLPFNND